MTLCIATACSALALVAQPAPEPLDPALSRLLDAAAQSEAEDDFADAVRVLGLSEDPAAIVAAAQALGRGDQARNVLGLPQDNAAMTNAGAPAADAVTEAPLDGGDDDSAEPGWRAVPMQVGRAFYAGESDLWDGRARLGLRFDAGNSDRRDYTAGLELTRTLAGWGFEGALEYAYSEVDGAVGRDQLQASARGERELGERWTSYLAGQYDQDALSGYDWTGFAGAGVGYRVLTNPARTLILRAGPGARLLTEVGGELETEAALDLGADFSAALTETVTFTSETGVLVAERGRADQRFALSTALGELWAIELKLHYRHEFEPEPGFEAGDTRTDLSIVREF